MDAAIEPAGMYSQRSEVGEHDPLLVESPPQNPTLRLWRIIREEKDVR